MNIGLLNVRIRIQKNTVTVDRIGNHINEWKDHYICHATVGSEGGSEKAVAGLIVDDSDIAFTVRFCKKTEEVESIGYRIVFQDELYDIESVDHMNYKKKCVKFKCRKVRR